MTRCRWFKLFGSSPDSCVCLHPRRRRFYISVSFFFFLLHASSPAFVAAALSPKLFNCFSTFSCFPSLPSNRLLHYAASASSLPSFLSAVSIVHLLPEGKLVLPSSCSAISVLLCCSRILLFRSRLLLFFLLLGRSTSFCAPPWPRALQCSCQPPLWGWLRPVLPPPLHLVLVAPGFCGLRLVPRER